MNTSLELLINSVVIFPPPESGAVLNGTQTQTLHLQLDPTRAPGPRSSHRTEAVRYENGGQTGS